GHGCEDFDGMCCINLSDHSSSTHKQLKQLQDAFHDLKIDEGGLDGWLRS
ncbi:hypothetical protein N309_04496, partial [Tinamus guttatus]